MNVSQIRFRSHLVILVALCGFGYSNSSFADITRITSINGNFDPNHSSVVEVRPGDIVSLSADELNDSNNFSSDDLNVESFIWNADDSVSDQCDVASSADCLVQSNFQATDYGVSFYVPYSMGAQITVTVSDRDDGSSDTVVLQNELFSEGNYVPPTTIVTVPEQYPYSTFDPARALAGQGRWVVIGDVRYFVPYYYNQTWQPYQNGYWTWSGDGMTWVSYDSWGWVTDHYGIWRRHDTFGWVWAPFDDLHYEPHCATFIYNDDDAYMGWYPFHSGYDRGYLQGPELGFRDGFENGYDSIRGYGSTGYGRDPGVTVVRYGDYRNANLVDVRIVDENIRIAEINRTFQNNHYGPHPGGSLEGSRQYVESRCGGPVSETQVVSRSFGGTEFRDPAPIRQVPVSYQVPGASERFNRPVPVGAIVSQGHDASHPVVISPTTNGRGVAMPPRAVDPQTGVVTSIPSHTQNPAQPNQGNPISHPAPIVQGHTPPGVPVYHPNQPNPQPTYAPHPVPQPQPHPAPQPQPQPHPAPQPQPQPHPAPQPQPQPHPAPQPQPQPHPAPQPQPQPQPHPAPQPQPQPHPAPQPQPQPHPAPQPQPQPHPAPQPQPQPHPAPQPQPQPHPAPQPQPQPHPAPQPQPQPHPAPQPQPQPHPAPQPQPQPHPAPQPQPQPHPAPQPQPQPRPTPHPHGQTQEQVG